MLIRILVDQFWSWWDLKAKCNNVQISFLKTFLCNIYNLYQLVNGSSIAWNSEFDGEPCFPHGQKSIFISGDAKIGKNCVIFQQVTIGSNTCPDSKRIGAPIIGDNCLIGAGAKIIGRVKIGSNVRIGANAVVFMDVPDNASVVVGDQRILTKQSISDNRFFSQRSGNWFFFQDGKWKRVLEPDICAKLDVAFKKKH